MNYYYCNKCQHRGLLTTKTCWCGGEKTEYNDDIFDPLFKWKPLSLINKTKYLSVLLTIAAWFIIMAIGAGGE